MLGYLLVFVGAGVGGAARHGVNTFAARLTGASLGAGTLTVNIVGSLLMGLLVAYLALEGEMSQPWRLFLATGALGGFTTFSAFSLDAVLLYERGQFGLAALYVLASVGVSIAALFLGLFTIRAMTGGSA